MRPEAFLLLSIAFGGMCMDLYTGKVRNAWILIGWITGFILQTRNYGLWGILCFLTGVSLPIILLFPIFRFRMLGAGDIKLLSALGGILGVREEWKCICCSFILGAIISLFLLFICQNLEERIHYFIKYLSEYKKTGKRVPYIVHGKRKENFPFTVPIFLAIVLYVGGFY